MQSEIIEFANSIGASEPDQNDDVYRLYRSLFRERNYFRHASGLLVVKISRSKKPFWGLTEGIIDLLNKHFSYNLILLTSVTQGWVFSKAETMRYIDRREWKLDAEGLEYKIHPPLPNANMFFGPKGCLKKLDVKGAPNNA
ncbi:hypothetical protein DWU98_09235 [Dyella monticola]|uniref:Uncharacterized protein n=1 Tax=Dyella monticola TaxID=1927958 RepID=A0A370X1T2_9GAMM|nr:hypothetical protein [Dyella monticola]RDS82211.1 hypothetical protein DWU98_09235 [Dyella monticola]